MMKIARNQSTHCTVCSTGLMMLRFWGICRWGWLVCSARTYICIKRFDRIAPVSQQIIDVRSFNGLWHVVESISLCRPKQSVRSGIERTIVVCLSQRGCRCMCVCVRRGLAKSECMLRKMLKSLDYRKFSSALTSRQEQIAYGRLFLQWYIRFRGPHSQTFDYDWWLIDRASIVLDFRRWYERVKVDPCWLNVKYGYETIWHYIGRTRQMADVCMSARLFLVGEATLSRITAQPIWPPCQWRWSWWPN